MVKVLAAKRNPRVMLKIGLVKAFDSVGWVFLSDLLSAIGCLRNWTNWISTILSTTSIKVLLNGSLGRGICHGWWLRQGDPLSPMIFMLLMECFNALITTAEAWGLMLLLGTSAIKHHISLYADDVIIFVSLVKTDLLLIRSILDLFFRATGLVAKFVKT
jgi:hypothetical protein